jgi:phage terminase large subunit-like protein
LTPTRNDKLKYLSLLEEKARRIAQNKLVTLFPDTGRLSRHEYKKHLEFFKAGAKYRERLFIAANRVGKTVVGGSELTYHTTGLYPDWWKGRKFEHKISSWAAGDTGETVRDIIQFELFGPFDDIGTGLVPARLIEGYTRRVGIPDALQSVGVKHVDGGISKIGLKSYDQKRKSFQGTAKEVIWLDEESSMEIYTECLLRTMTTEGLMILTFTPLLGISDVVKAFLPSGKLSQEIE